MIFKLGTSRLLCSGMSSVREIMTKKAPQLVHICLCWTRIWVHNTAVAEWQSNISWNQLFHPSVSSSSLASNTNGMMFAAHFWWGSLWLLSLSSQDLRTRHTKDPMQLYGKVWQQMDQTICHVPEYSSTRFTEHWLSHTVVQTVQMYVCSSQHWTIPDRLVHATAFLPILGPALAYINMLQCGT
jgi:hypothetical protein